MKPQIEKILSEEQAGFRSGRGTIDQIFTIKKLAEHTLGLQDHKLYNIFIDFKKAFDRVWHDGLFGVLNHYKISPKLIHMIQDLYSRGKSSVKVDDTLTDWFLITIGVRQGCLLSPDLFNLYLHHIVQEALRHNQDGVQVADVVIKTAAFADDIDQITRTEAAAQSTLTAINNSGKDYGMEISKEKTKILVHSKEPTKTSITLDGVELEQVNQFQYLGSTITTDNSSKPEIYRRCALASAAFGKLEPIWKDKKIQYKTKWRLFNALVLPVALYGCETWTINKQCMKKLAAFEMICIRKILKINWQEKKTNEEVIQLAGFDQNWTNICVKIKQRQAQWYGHVLRMGKERIPKKTLEDTTTTRPNQKKKVGNPGLKWENTVLKQLDLKNRDEAKNIAMNRERWRQLIQFGANVR